MVRHAAKGRRRCLKRFGRTPGRVAGLAARRVSATKIALTFRAPGTDGSRPPAVRAYLVRQSLRPIRNARDFRRARMLCKGACRFSVTAVGAKITLTVTDLRPKTTYYYAIVARDNITGQLWARSQTVSARTP